MKLRKYFTLALHCLLVFGFCLPLIAEEDEPKLPSIAEIAEMIKPKTLEKAKENYRDLDHYYDLALAITIDAKFAHAASDRVLGVLTSALALKKSERDSTLANTVKSIYDGIEAVSLDPVDIISDKCQKLYTPKLCLFRNMS